MGYRKLSARPRHHAQTEGAIEDFKKTSPSIFVAAPQGPITGFKMKRTGGASDQIVLDGLDANDIVPDGINPEMVAALDGVRTRYTTSPRCAPCLTRPKPLWARQNFHPTLWREK